MPPPPPKTDEELAKETPVSSARKMWGKAVEAAAPAAPTPRKIASRFAETVSAAVSANKASAGGNKTGPTAGASKTPVGPASASKTLAGGAAGRATPVVASAAAGNKGVAAPSAKSPEPEAEAPAPAEATKDEPAIPPSQEVGVLAKQLAELKAHLHNSREECAGLQKKVQHVPELEREIEKLKNAMFVREPERVALHVRNIEEENRRLRKQYASAQEHMATQEGTIQKLEAWIAKLQREIVVLQGTAHLPGYTQQQQQQQQVLRDDAPSPPPPPPPEEEAEPPAPTTTKKLAGSVGRTAVGGAAVGKGAANTASQPEATKAPAAAAPQPSPTMEPVKPKVLILPSPTSDVLTRSLGLDTHARPSPCNECSVKIRAMENATQLLRVEHEKRQVVLQNMLDGARREIDALKGRITAQEELARMHALASSPSPARVHNSNVNTVAIPHYARSSHQMPTPSDGWASYDGGQSQQQGGGGGSVPRMNAETSPSPSRSPYYFNVLTGTSRWSSPYA